MKLAIFDLDHTLLEGDCDQLWGDFLVAKGLVDATDYQTQKNKYYQDYLDGTLDVEAFLQFGARVLAQFSVSQLEQLGWQFSQQYIIPRLRQEATAMLRNHQQKGDCCLVMTATNHFLARWATHTLPLDALLASELEQNNNGFTGRTSGIPNYREGKVARLNQWLNQTDVDLSQATFYSDSHNDLPLLNQVGYPVAVTPDKALKRHAIEHHWKIVDWSQKREYSNA